MGSHPAELAHGQHLAPGETASLSAEQVRDPHNKSLIEEGVLQSIAPDGGSKKSKGGEE